MAMNIEDVYPGNDIMMAGRFNVAVVGWYYSTVCNLKLSYTLPYVNSYALLSKVSTIPYRMIIMPNDTCNKHLLKIQTKLF